MVRTYWLVPGFNEASGNLDLQPFARIDHVEACRPVQCLSIVRGRSLGSNCRAALQVFDQLGREAGHLVEVVNRPEAPEALAVGKQPRRLGHREVLRPQLFEGDRVEVDGSSGLGCRGRRRLGWSRRGRRRRSRLRRWLRRQGGLWFRRQWRLWQGRRRSRLRRWRLRRQRRDRLQRRRLRRRGLGRGLQRRGLGRGRGGANDVSPPPCTETITACSASAARRSASRARSSAWATLSSISCRR